MFQKKNNQMILEQLRNIGLAETDALAYMTSIHLGACSVGQLTTKTKINRITVHDSVARLISKWLLLETYSGKRRLVYPQQVSSLQHIVDSKKAELDQLQLNVNKTMSMLSSLQLQSDYLPRIRISKWRQGITDMIREIKEETSDELCIICDSRHFDELLNVHFLDNLSKYSGSIRMILPAWFEHFVFSAYAKWLKIQTYTMPDHMKRSGGMTIRNNKVALHAYEGLFITTTIIENNPIHTMMMNNFESLWDK
jgi:hypothetical protein